MFSRGWWVPLLRKCHPWKGRQLAFRSAISPGVGEPRLPSVFAAPCGYRHPAHYAADAWGFTVGAAAERYLKSWTFRAGVFDLSNVPNSVHLDPGFHEFQIDAEVEKRYELFGQTGRVLITGFDSRGRMGLLDAAIRLAAVTGSTPKPADVRQYRSRLGVSLGLEQPLSADLGVFARVGKAAGNVETYEFTDIDRSAAVGASIKGLRWGGAPKTPSASPPSGTEFRRYANAS